MLKPTYKETNIMLTILDGNNVFRKHFYLEATPEQLERTLKQITFDNPNTIWVFDGYNNNAKRRIIFPEYKAGFEDKEISPDDKAMFEMLHEFRTVTLPSWGALVLCFDGWEADDIIYNLVKFIPVKEVISTDKDFWQMLKVNPELQLPDTNDCPCDPSEIILYKTLVGDKSDNISGLKSFGVKAFEKLLDTDKASLTAFLSGESDEPVVVSCPKLQAKLDPKLDELRVFWKVISFIEIDDDTFSEMIGAVIK